MASASAAPYPPFVKEDFMASTPEWKLSTGTARVFPAKDGSLADPVILAADGQTGATDFAAFEAGVGHSSYWVLGELRKRSRDLILVGYNDAAAPLAERAKAVEEAISRTISEQSAFSPLVVGGIGEGALVARYALAHMEFQHVDHQTGTYFSYNGTAPTQEQEIAQLRGMGDWPARPRTLNLVSGEFKSNLDAEEFDESKTGAANPGGSAITKELGSWLLEKIG
ncbi:hypothetical protein B046DRAFT_03774 [Streptomyces sp. LamerLS-316]|nr:hypothetical protein B046DRAFT_03774 [Streptomyces sp. LamerLS-316]